MDVKTGYRVERRNWPDTEREQKDNPWVPISYFDKVDPLLAKTIFGRECRMPDSNKYEFRLIHFSEATQLIASHRPIPYTV